MSVYVRIIDRWRNWDMEDKGLCIRMSFLWERSGSVAYARRLSLGSQRQPKKAGLDRVFHRGNTRR